MGLTKEVLLVRQIRKDTGKYFHLRVADTNQTLSKRHYKEQRNHRSFIFPSSEPGIKYRLQTRQPEPLVPLQCGV